MLLPGVSIFLDVDDLKDIGELETNVEQSALVMMFVSQGYVRGAPLHSSAQPLRTHSPAKHAALL